MAITPRAFPVAALLLGLFSLLARAAQPSGVQPTTAPPNGPRRAEPSFHAITGATVHVSPTQRLERATLVVRDGRIVSVTPDAPAPTPTPAGARVWDGAGLHIYAGFIDPFVEVDAPRAGPEQPGAHWNALVTPQRSALDGPGLDSGTAESLRSLGFVAAGVSPKGGLMRGRSALVSTAPAPEEVGSDPRPVYARDVYHTLAFETRADEGPGADAGYPTSHMGVIALWRQGLLDADWQAGVRGASTAPSRELAAAAARVAPPPNALDPLHDLKDRPLAFDVRDELEALRGLRVAQEFGRSSLVIGSGLEFRRLEAIKAAGADVILPLRWPRTPDVSSVGKAESVELRDLMTWEQAPTNPRRLDAAGLRVSLTTSKIPDRATFRERLRRAIAFGLPVDRALAMLTTHPAEQLGVQDRLGTLEPGKIASFLVVDGPVFEKASTLRWVWIDGVPHELPAPAADSALRPILGTWRIVEADGRPVRADDAGAPRVIIEKDSVRVVVGDVTVKADRASVTPDRADFVYDEAPFTAGPGEDRPAARVVIDSAVRAGGRLLGTSLFPSGRVHRWAAERQPADPAAANDGADADAPGDDEEAKENARLAADVPERLGHPFGPYMLDAQPEQGSVLLTNATIWTASDLGVIEGGSVLIQNGTIAQVISVPGLASVAPALAGDAVVIDCAGRHITPGIVDAHSHTGVFETNANEAGQAVTAEVRIGDTVNPDNISWYRQLAAGVTTVNSLHGSANPIGGQSQTHKIRWGVPDPEAMKFEGARPGIKFALGENVKQSNWGERFTTRYPQTRMGVESLILDRFEAARAYAQQRRAPGPVPPRRDLELEALAEVLAGERLVHCHAYRQDEMLMLCRLAERFGFRIGTFQHALEGYKVAEALKAHTIGASMFADWWSFKIETQDGIGAGGAILWETGVNLSYNSDSDELARRLNTEAAKAGKYGSVPPEEQIKLVTINPATQLGIADRVGSIEPGKDADLVVWSGPPLSGFSRVERTFVDGRERFSLEQDAAHRAAIAAERTRLLAKALATSRSDADKDDAEPAPSTPPTTPQDAAEELRRFARDHAREARLMDLVRRGIDPAFARCGDCGESALHTR